MDGDGIPLGEPVLLASSGERLPDGDPTVWVSDWDVDEEIDYAPLIA
jgi:hypothetical protein